MNGRLHAHATQTTAPARAIARRDIARSFGQAAPRYDDHADLQRQVAEALLHKIPANVEPRSMLDLGCGTGFCSKVLRERHPAADLFALDLALPMLLAAAHKVPALDLVCADAEALPFHAHGFDLIVSSLAMQWCATPRLLFGELFRIAMPGAHVLLSTFGPATLREVASAWHEVNADVHVNAFVSCLDLEREARACGFEFAMASDMQQRRYDSLLAVARELKGIGAHNMNAGRSTGLTGRVAFTRAERAFRGAAPPDQGVPVSYEIYYLVLRKPA